MTGRRLLIGASLVLGLTIAAPIGAQTRGDAAPSSSAPAPAGTLDIGDLWHRLLRRQAPDAQDEAAAARRRALVVAPTFGSKPSTGFSLGVASNLAFFEGDPKTTHISTMNGGVRVTQKQQLLSGVRFSIFTDNDRWFLTGDNRFSLTSQGVYGLGTDTLATDVLSTKYRYVRFFETAYRQVSHRLFIGGGLDVDTHTDVRPGNAKATASWDDSPLVTYSLANGFSPTEQTSAGSSVNLLFDTRDSGINPKHGWFANASYRTYFNGFLGGDSTWQELVLDTRTYRKLTNTGRQMLAFWLLGDMVTGGTAPYLDLPTIGSDGRSGRGYGEGRFRGEHLLYGEMEYRGTISPNGLFGMVAFLNTTTVSNTQENLHLGDSFAPGGGIGLRVLLNKRSRTNLCADYGWGIQASRGFYLSIQEAF
jgi:hypothetical protein